MGFLLIDILVFAVMAAFLFFRFRDVLGTKHGSERERKTIFDDPKTTEQSVDTEDDETLDGTDTVTPFPVKKPKVKVDTSLDGVLTRIALQDRTFTPEDFIHGAKAAFEMIVEAFARGDSKKLEPLLSPELMDAFESTIKDRQKKGLIATTDILNIKKAEIKNAVLTDKKAVITVRFVADETKYVRNKQGEIISGDPEAVTETIDIWSFEKDITISDPNWILIATQTEDK